MHLNTLAKLLILLLFNTLVLYITPIGVYFYIYILLWCLPLLLFFLNGYLKISLHYLIILIILNGLQILLVPHLTGTLFFVVLGIISVSIRIMPGFLMFYFFIKSTKTNQFITTMQDLRIPKGIILSFSVMFRFIPTIKEEYRLIQYNLKLRNLTGINILIHPFKSIEYRIIPLIVCVANIGKDLTVAGLIRGLSSPNKTSQLCKEKWAWSDYSFVILLVILWFICIVGKGVTHA
ncbi:hypothetical protein HMPREF2580_10920 [Staphylococcus sp. HMSC036D05]|uniref:energy-coupling factor transporter transmembrane component T family protein n=1 Tax=Staphylococcus sp. HMSC036D05 TaxID=1715059 RepID=UPI0008A8F887|nr:energy-coupling factor transporter transmembrane component T [Staphylococcus sp. HMSC036D05]OHO68051.1 hypothetical protein HMPREF2580_10920 [Staphylococcus sp. HMSC036D05]